MALEKALNLADCVIEPAPTHHIERALKLQLGGSVWNLIDICGSRKGSEQHRDDKCLAKCRLPLQIPSAARLFVNARSGFCQNNFGQAASTQ